MIQDIVFFFFFFKQNLEDLMVKLQNPPPIYLTYVWLMNYDIEWEFRGLPPIIMLIYIHLDKYKAICIPKQ